MMGEGCVRKLGNGVQMGYNPLINEIYWGSNPITNLLHLLLTSWDIQVVKDFRPDMIKHLTEFGFIHHPLCPSKDHLFISWGSFY